MTRSRPAYSFSLVDGFDVFIANAAASTEQILFDIRILRLTVTLEQRSPTASGKVVLISRGVSTMISGVGAQDYHPVVGGAAPADQSPKDQFERALATARGTTVGANSLSWGTDKGGVTVTDVIKDGKGQTLGTLKLDRRTDTVTVTPFDSSTGKPDLNGQSGREVFRLDTAGNVVVSGDYPTIDNPNDPDNEFFGGSRYQQISLPAGNPLDPNSPVTIEVFKNGDNGIGALAITPAKNPAKGPDFLELESSFTDRGRISALYVTGFDSNATRVRNFTSPAPPREPSVTPKPRYFPRWGFR